MPALAQDHEVAFPAPVQLGGATAHRASAVAGNACQLSLRVAASASVDLVVIGRVLTLTSWLKTVVPSLWLL